MPFPSAIRLFLSFLRLGLTAFGGPAMIANIKELSVKKKKWLNEENFNHGIVLCQSIPGATAMQMAGYVGLRIKGIRGALASYVGFGLPAFVLMLTFSVLYDNYHDLSFVRFLICRTSGHCGGHYRPGHLFVWKKHRRSLPKCYYCRGLCRFLGDRSQSLSGHTRSRVGQYHLVWADPALPVSGRKS